ncbi:cysteine peptidase family C39 domain-containing protein [Candidatus Avoscillospira sp. LCP25S3_F1]|uniref:cysteine peptidase family C39 domain-containing protein n=1 Tax=Candidatus Avoscillospira sp. LCP25S3_F1 TaxID=3438825 RepID=UPI003F9313B4
MKKRRPMSRVELILQTSPTENAAAALAMVLSCYQGTVPARELLERPIASAADLVTEARKRGIYAQGYRMTPEELAQAPMPLIAHWNFHAFVVVTGVRHGRVYLYSPENGRQVLTRRAFAEGFTGVAVCFTGERESETPRRPKSQGRRMGGAAGPALLAAAQLWSITLCLALAVLTRGIATQLSSPQTGSGRAICLGLLAVLALQGAAAGVQGIVLRRYRRRREEQECGQFQQFLQGETSTFFEKTSRYRLDVAARACKAVPAAEAQSMACRLQLAGGIACLAVVAMQNWTAGLAAAVVAAVLAAVCHGGREQVYSDLQLADRARFLAAEEAAEDLEAAEEQRLGGQTSARFQQWVSLAGAVERPSAISHQRWLWWVAAGVQLLAVLLLCLAEMTAGRAGMADLAGCMALTIGSALSMGAFPRLLEQQARIRWMNEMTALVRGRDEEAAADVPITANSLTLQNISLQQADGDAVVARGITVTVRRGEILMIAAEEVVRRVLGPVAAGLERPRQGQIYLGATELTALGERKRCQMVTLLGGGLPMPQGTVRQNIAAGRTDITDYAVVEAASDALLHPSILRRRQGYDTPAATLSAGEQVLLEVACAFARGAPVLIADGLTERLDPETEQQLFRALRRRGVGTVVLTEDPARLRLGDLACRVEHGQVTLLERSAWIDGEVVSRA